jgi:hypothetical protein
MGRAECPQSRTLIGHGSRKRCGQLSLSCPNRRRRLCWAMHGWKHSLGLNTLRLSLIARAFLAIWTSSAFTTILHVVLVDTESFVDFGTKGVIVVDPIIMSVRQRYCGIELYSQAKQFITFHF